MTFIEPNRAFFSCTLSDLAFVWTQGRSLLLFWYQCRCKCKVVISIRTWFTYIKCREGCIKTEWTPASLPFKDQVTKDNCKMDYTRLQQIHFSCSSVRKNNCSPSLLYKCLPLIPYPNPILFSSSMTSTPHLRCSSRLLKPQRQTL